ncbi:MAG: hypothetical protein BroJett029_06850 [Alphaproteobacteria bacterium]|nr:MAG: hypothetical protein BroJett029_06850 [Alphaproteobacteria bacterium]
MVKIGTEELPLERLDRPRLQLVLQHWQALRGGRAMPARREIDPVALEGALGIVMIARYEPERDDFRFSLFGSEVATSQRIDYTHRLASELEPKVYAELVLKSYRQVRATGLPYYGRLSIGGDRELVSYYRLVLPLGNDGAHVDAVVVASDHEKAFWQTLYDEERERGGQAG